MKIPTIESISKEQLQFLKDKISFIIPSSQSILTEKFLILIEYNQCFLENKTNNILSLEEYCLSLNTTEIRIEVSKADISRLKKNINLFNYTNALKDKFILNSDGLIQVDRKITLNTVHEFYREKSNLLNSTSNQNMKNLDDIKSFKEYSEVFINDDDIDFFSSIKIFDFYKNTQEKIQLFTNSKIAQTLKADGNKIKKLEIISIIDSSEINNILSLLHSNFKKNNHNVLTIKHIPYNENSYIPSLFFVLVKFKLKNSSNYKEYLFYLEEEINFASIGYVSKSSSTQFYELLEKRFDTQFYNPNNIEFYPKDEQDIFEDSVNEIVADIKNILYSLSDTDEENIQNLKNKIVLLKLHYPKMNNAYSLLRNLEDYIISINQIYRDTKKEKILSNSTYLIKQILEQKINPSINEILQQIQTNQLVMKKNINIKQLRTSVYINLIANSNQSFSDIFNDLNWSSTNDILLSLDTIDNSVALLKKFFSFFNIDNMPFKTMQNLFKERIMNQILEGEPISFGSENII